MTKFFPACQKMLDKNHKPIKTLVFLNVEQIVAVYPQDTLPSTVIVDVNCPDRTCFIFPEYPGGVQGFMEDMRKKAEEL